MLFIVFFWILDCCICANLRSKQNQVIGKSLAYCLCPEFYRGLFLLENHSSVAPEIAPEKLLLHICWNVKNYIWHSFVLSTCLGKLFEYCREKRVVRNHLCF